MNTQAPGKNTSRVQVKDTSAHGIWLLSGENELFMSYDDSPWFRDVPIGKIFNIQELSPSHYYWPDLDVDVEHGNHRAPRALSAQGDKRLGGLSTQRVRGCSKKPWSVPGSSR